jgi:hypothetical protein
MALLDSPPLWKLILHLNAYGFGNMFVLLNMNWGEEHGKNL